MSIAVGIDLGTTNSVVGVATPEGVKLAALEGMPIHPSIVSFPEEGGVLVGQLAKERRALDPVNTIYSAKRLIGQNMRAPMVKLALSSLPYRVEEGTNQQPIIKVRGRRMTVPEVSALIISHLKELAEDQFGEAVREVVITVPANFSDAQRQATKEAGVIAGLEVLRLVNEPTAAALAYGYGQRLDEKVGVFDFGGGTFDASVLKIRSEIFEVLATDGDFFLGGDDIDRAVAEFLAAEMNRSLAIDPRPHPTAMTRLSLAAEEIKCYLSDEYEAAGDIDGIVLPDRSEPLSLPFEINRAQFDNLIEGYVDIAIGKFREVLVAAKVDPKDLSDVILVGGSTRIPMVRDRLAELIGQEAASTINADEVVGHGAAVQGAMLSGSFTEVPEDSPAVDASGGTGGDKLELDISAEPPKALLLDVTPARLSVATAGGYTEQLLEKNAPIPIERTKRFTTARDNQTRVVIGCCRGNDKKFEDNELLGELVLDNIPPGTRGQVQLDVTFRVDTDGILHVRAEDARTGQKQEAELNVIGAPVPGDSADSDRPRSN